MIENNKNFYRDIVINTCIDVTDITFPNVSGSQNNVLFVQSSYKDMVVKFNNRSMVEKNMRVSAIYHDYGIPAPDVRIAYHKGQWLEVYPMIHGKTLFECTKEGMAKDAIRHAYDELVRNFVKMDGIPLHLVKDLKIKTASQVSYIYFKNTNGTIVANVLNPLVSLLMRGSDSNIGLYHHDISPRNVIVSPKGELKAFIDMDSVALCNRDFALAALASRWQQQGYDINELLDMVEDLSHRHTNRNRVKAQAALTRTGKYLLWRLRHMKSNQR